MFFGAEAVDVTALTGEVDLTNLFEYVLKSKGLSGLKLTLFKNENNVVLLPAESSAITVPFEDTEEIRVLKAGEELTIGISEEAETLEEQLKELEGYGSLYDLYPCGEKYYLGPKYAGVSSASTVKVTKYAIDGVKLSLMFTSYDLSSEDFGGKVRHGRGSAEFPGCKGHLEYRLAGAVFTWLGKIRTFCMWEQGQQKVRMIRKHWIKCSFLSEDSG